MDHSYLLNKDLPSPENDGTVFRYKCSSPGFLQDFRKASLSRRWLDFGTGHLQCGSERLVDTSPIVLIVQ